MLNRCTHKTLGTLTGDWLNTKTGGTGEAHLGHSHLVRKKVPELFGFGGALFELYTSVDILGVLTENSDVNILGTANGRGNAMEPAHRAKAYVEVELLAKSYVKRPKATTDRGGEWALDSHKVFAVSFKGLLRKPASSLAESLFSGQDLKPLHLALAAICLFHCSVKNLDTRSPNIRANTIAFNKRDNGLIRYVQLASGAHGNGGAACRGRHGADARSNLRHALH
mmetsp:Transcript_2626/g.5103  ORF Transcript_2626/g.5103 Transcript_2626/m.5103 type:complete len:225 (-) Transcript_2626:127-801(-)